MAEHDTVPREADDEADDNEDASSITSMECVLGSNREEDAPEQQFTCQDCDCTWPCAHHLHEWGPGNLLFQWYPDLEQFSYQNPKMSRARSEMKVGMKDCAFCRIFFTIGDGESDCPCGANGHDDHIPENGGCRCIKATCDFRWNEEVSQLVLMKWTCGEAKYELGLPTGKVVWSLYDLSNESFLARPSSSRRPPFPIHIAMHGRLTLRPSI